MKITIFAISLYLLSLTFPFKSYISLFVLSLSGVLTVLWSKEERNNISKLISYSLTAFLTSVIISSFLSVDIERSFLLNLSFFPALLILFIICEVTDINLIYALYIVLSGVGAIISAIALCYFFLNITEENPSVWIEKMGNPNIIVPNDLMLLSVLIPFSLSIIYSKLSFAFKILPILSIFLCIWTIIIYQSRGALILSAISACYMIIFLKSFLFFSLSSIITITILIVNLKYHLPLISKFSGIWSTRIPYWLVALSMFADAPLLGHGSHTYATLYNTYKNKIEIPDWVIVDGRFTPWAHNLYLEILAEQGILGLTSLIVLLIFGFKTAWNTCNSYQKEIKILGLGAFLGLSTISMGAIFELSFIRHWVVIMLFSILGIIISLSNKEEKGEN